MFKPSLLALATVAGLSFAAAPAHAAFMITTTLTSNANPATALSLMPGSIVNAPVPTPDGGISFNFLQVNYTGSNATLSTSFTVTGSFAVNNNGVLGTGTFSESFDYNVTAGFGSLKSTGSSITPLVAGVNFGPISFAPPTVADGSVSTGNLSTNLTASAVPEPASLFMAGTATLAGLGCTWYRRRRDAA